MEFQYWKVESPKDFSLDNFPIFVYQGISGRVRQSLFYGIPIYEYPGILKLS